MNGRSLAIIAVALGMGLTGAVPASAHRVDEYLQATRIAVGMDRVDLEIDLTPGMSVASVVSGWIDTNRDGSVSAAEAEAYAQEILRSVSLSVDGRDVKVTFNDIQVPKLRAMSEGIGTIRLRAFAKTGRTWLGQHRVVYSNTHRSESSVYLINALVPDNSRIQIAGQQRDRAQHGLTVEYTVAARWMPVLLIGLAMAGAVGVSTLPRPSAPS